MKKNIYRVAICEHTKKEVLQIQSGDEWLCLHYDNDVIDKVAVDAFRAGMGIYE